MISCLGTDLDYATEIKFYLRGNSGTVSAAASLRDKTSAGVTFSNLTQGTEYTYYAVVTVEDGTSVTSAEATFTTLKPNTSIGWLEIPARGAVGTAREYRVKDDVGERNYSAYYDTETYSSLWVAYPLAAGHTGSLSRSDKWAAYDEIPVSEQINLWDGSYGVAYTPTTYKSNHYARGHQIANADRNGKGQMQIQTFLTINSTPQIQNGFNGGIWNSLETAVQTHAKSLPASDSLYVTTGPVYKTVGGSETITYIQPQHDTKSCPVPNYYYKVLLKVKRSGDTVTDAMAVGFWFEHKEYSDAKAYLNYAVSVDEIERKTGFDFFANLPNAIESAAERNTNWDSFTAFR